MTKTAPSTATYRQATFEDRIEATELLRSLGLTMPEGSDAINAHWRRLWIDNPAIKTDSDRKSLGMVLEKNGRIGGFFCNVPLIYYFGDRRVNVSIASQWGLEKIHRGKILNLASSYFAQNNIDITMATTANLSAGRIFLHFGAQRVPQPDYDQVLYWIIDGGGFMVAALRRKKISPLVSQLISAPTGPLVRFAQAMGWRRPTGRHGKVDLIEPKDIDDRFDGLWQRKRDEAERLLACRSATSLRWHFSGVLPEKQTRILIHGGSVLHGYAVVMREDVTDIGLKRLRLADVFVENDDPVLIDDLLAASYEYGRQQGCHVLEWVGLPAHLRRIALAHNPLVRTLPTWPLFYRAADVGLNAALAKPDAWYITPYDGDTTLA